MAGATNVSYGSQADIPRHGHLCLLLGVKQTPKVRFQGPAMDPPGAEDVTDMLGKRHGYVGHGFVCALVVFGLVLPALREFGFP